ncbi:MAG: TRAP transporter substrate-binding protein DctP [Sorangiineae bacterium]|nr:TRAP transporter substrate-binding protein DctP [Polyangiaceae bacterium]MEB2324104.1 TRAP transporter substrate-binding protein DctP [Sorangiineae bacterium]
MIRKISAALVAATVAVIGTTSVAQAKTTLKIGTLAPPRSPWGKVFKTWTKAVDKKTNGEVELTWLWNGTAGPEDAVVGKIKSGQLSGAAITAVGLSKIYHPILALQIPGTFSSWAQLDSARKGILGETQRAMADAGFFLGGFGDVGIGHVMSKGFAVKMPEDMKGKHPGTIRDDVIGPKIYQVIGGVSAVPSDVTGFLPLLNSGAIDIMSTPALAAEQLQWASRLDHINTGDVYFSIGALVLSKKQLDAMPEDQRKIVEETGDLAAKALTKSIRSADSKSFERLKKKMEAHDPTDAEKAAWKEIYKKACQRMKGADFPAEMLAKIKAC